MLQRPNSRTARASVVRMASSLWIWHTIMKIPACAELPSTQVYSVSLRCTCLQHLYRPFRMRHPKLSNQSFRSPASVLIGEAQPLPSAAE